MSNPTRDPTATTATTCLEDAMLVAYMKLKGHIAIPWISRDDPADPRVSFDLQGDNEKIESDMQGFYNNEQVGIQDFTRAYKEVKSQMYSLKRIGAGRK
jgi:hypothetical protein